MESRQGAVETADRAPALLSRRRTRWIPIKARQLAADIVHEFLLVDDGDDLCSITDAEPADRTAPPLKVEPEL